MDNNVAKYKEGFQKGYGQLQIKDLRAAQKDLWAALGINNRNSLIAYRKGAVEPKISQVSAVEAVFKKYGITDVWGK